MKRKRFNSLIASDTTIAKEWNLLQQSVKLHRRMNTIVFDDKKFFVQDNT